MLAIGMTMNGFTVLSAVGHTRRGAPDGAVIFAVRRDEDGVTWVNARVEQRQIDDPEPAKFWGNGDYHEGEAAYDNAHASFLDRAGIIPLPDPDEPKPVGDAAIVFSDGDDWIAPFDGMHGYLAELTYVDGRTRDVMLREAGHFGPMGLAALNVSDIKEDGEGPEDASDVVACTELTRIYIY